MGRRGALTLALGAGVFVGVVLLMLPAEVHFVRHTLPAALVAGAVAAALGWRGL